MIILCRYHELLIKNSHMHAYPHTLTDLFRTQYPYSKSKFWGRPTSSVESAVPVVMCVMGASVVISPVLAQLYSFISLSTSDWNEKEPSRFLCSPHPSPSLWRSYKVLMKYGGLGLDEHCKRWFSNPFPCWSEDASLLKCSSYNLRQETPKHSVAMVER